MYIHHDWFMQQCSPSQLDHRWGKSTVVHRTTRTVVVHRRGCLRRGTGKTWTCTEGGLDRNVDLPGHCSGKSTIVYRATMAFIVELVQCPGESGQLVCKSAGLVIERLRFRTPAGVAGVFSSPESTLCADSYSVSVLYPCYRSST